MGGESRPPPLLVRQGDRPLPFSFHPLPYPPDSYQSKLLDKCLDTAEREKKKKYLHAFLNKRQNFTSFVSSVDGLIGVEAEETFKHLAIRLATKRKEPYSRTCGYVKSRVKITQVNSTQGCIRGGRDPASQISVTCPQWEIRSGLHLFQ